jgi:hypothetical protein
MGMHDPRQETRKGFRQDEILILMNKKKSCFFTNTDLAENNDRD